MQAKVHEEVGPNHRTRPVSKQEPTRKRETLRRPTKDGRRHPPKNMLLIVGDFNANMYKATNEVEKETIGETPPLG